MVEVGTGGVGSRFIKTDWPNESGLEAGTEKQEGRQINLVAEEKVLILDNEKEGI